MGLHPLGTSIGRMTANMACQAQICSIPRTISEHMPLHCTEVASITSWWVGVTTTL